MPQAASLSQTPRHPGSHVPGAGPRLPAPLLGHYHWSGAQVPRIVSLPLGFLECGSTGFGGLGQTRRDDPTSLDDYSKEKSAELRSHVVLLFPRGQGEEIAKQGLASETAPVNITAILAEATRGVWRSKLERVWREASGEGWDGYRAAPVTEATYRNARALLDHIPMDFPGMEITADQDGEISLDWQLGRDRVFSIAVSASGKISYAGLFGANTTHGTEWYKGALPEVVMFHLARLFPGRPSAP